MTELEPIEPEQPNSGLELNTPSGLLPDLELWGIEPIEPGICEDTYENRKLIRENKAVWKDVFTKNGEPTNLLQVITPEMKQALLMANKSIILKDSRNPDSDYLTGADLLFEHGIENIVPAWVIAATKLWNKIENERLMRGEDAPLYRPSIAGPPARCRSKTIDGRRCSRWANGLVDYDGLCRAHLTTAKRNGEVPEAPNTMVRARNRLQSAALGAVDHLEKLMETAESEPVQLGAAKELLDRAGLRGGVEIDLNGTVEVRPAAEILKERLADSAKKLEEARLAKEAAELEELSRTVDAEIVEDEEEAAGGAEE